MHVDRLDVLAPSSHSPSRPTALLCAGIVVSLLGCNKASDGSGGTDPGSGGPGGGGTGGGGVVASGRFETEDLLDLDDGGGGGGGGDPDLGIGQAGELGEAEILAWQVEQPGPRSLTVSWTTNVPTLCELDWGTSEELGAIQSSGNDLALEHAVTLENLGEGVTYWLHITAAAPAGSVDTEGPFSALVDSADGRTVSGTLTKWHPVTLTFEGPAFSEADESPNPFLDRRLWIDFSAPSGATMRVEGFFAGDGAGGSLGTAWQVRAAFFEEGTWEYTVHFREGAGVATNLDPAAGQAGMLAGLEGLLPIGPRDTGAPGFLSFGALEYVGAHYLKFRDGPYFLKGGTDSPENLFGFEGFDDTWDEPGGASTSGLPSGLHRFLPHVEDFGEDGLGDDTSPLFTSSTTGVDSRGLVGALDYLASRGVNSAYFLPMNLGGDGRDTWPFLGPLDSSSDKLHYDLSKLHQWGLVFAHAMRRGIALHLVLGETEWDNEHWLDNGQLGPKRKIFYRELVARFGHHSAIKWNLGEETNHQVPQLEEFAAWIQELTPYEHPIAFHTHGIGPSGDYAPYSNILGNPLFQATSLQASPNDSGPIVERWRADSAAAGHPWVIDFDEQTEGLTETNTNSLRKQHLWDVFLSGGQLEWYFGYHGLPLGGDLRTENFRTREAMWDQMRYAREFLEALPFWEMQPQDDLMTDERQAYGGGEVFARPGEVYALYMPVSDLAPTLNLSSAPGTFHLTWFDPRNGVSYPIAAPINGGAPVSLGLPPFAHSQDWAALVERD